MHGYAWGTCDEGTELSFCGSRNRSAIDIFFLNGHDGMSDSFTFAEDMFVAILTDLLLWLPGKSHVMHLTIVNGRKACRQDVRHGGAPK